MAAGSDAIEPIRRTKLYEQVVDRLIAMFRSGAIPPGEPLPSERELMRRFGVGRPAVREALQFLQHRGLVTIRHGEHARAILPTPDSILELIGASATIALQHDRNAVKHLLDARVFFEAGIARMAAERASDEAVAQIGAALEENRQAIRETSRFVATDLAFHAKIAETLGNPIYPVVSTAMLGWLNVHREDMVRVPGAEELSHREHRQIFEAIRRRDPDAAAQRMAEHIQRADTAYSHFGAAHEQ